MIIIGVSRLQFGSNWQSLTVITVDLSSRVTFLQAVRQELTFTFLLDEIVLSSMEGTFRNATNEKVNKR